MAEYSFNWDSFKRKPPRTKSHKSYSFDWGIIERKPPQATLSELGIAITKESIDYLDKPDYILIGYDDNNKIIAIKPCENKEDFAIKASGKLSQNWARFGCKNFIKMIFSDFKLDINHAYRFPIKFVKEPKMILIDMNANAMMASRSKKTRR